LAEASGVSLPTVRRLEAADGELGGREETAAKIVDALETAGIEFTNGGEPGVKLRAQYDPKTGLIGPDPFQGGDGFQRVVTSELRRPARPKKPPE